MPRQLAARRFSCVGGERARSKIHAQSSSSRLHGDRLYVSFRYKPIRPLTLHAVARKLGCTATFRRLVTSRALHSEFGGHALFCMNLASRIADKADHSVATTLKIEGEFSRLPRRPLLEMRQRLKDPWRPSSKRPLYRRKVFGQAHQDQLVGHLSSISPLEENASIRNLSRPVGVKVVLAKDPYDCWSLWQRNLRLACR